MSVPKLVKLREPIKLEVDGRTVRVHRIEPALLDAAQSLADGVGVDVHSAWLDMSHSGPGGSRHRHLINLRDNEASPILCVTLGKRHHIDPSEVRYYFAEMNQQALVQLMEALVARVRQRTGRKPEAGHRPASEWPFVAAG